MRPEEPEARGQGALTSLTCVDAVGLCLFLLISCQAPSWSLLDPVYLRLPACGSRLGQHAEQDEIIGKSVLPEAVAESGWIILQLIWPLDGITPIPICSLILGCLHIHYAAEVDFEF